MDIIINLSDNRILQYGLTFRQHSDAVRIEALVCHGSGGSRGGPWPPPVGGLKNFIRQYIDIITKPTAYNGPWEY